jgi:dihydroflavonol-4-reductase
MKVFVTGGNGFVGSSVVHELARRGHAVTCLVRPTSNLRRIEDVAFTKAVGDILDPPSLVRGMADCDAVIHLACVSSWADIRSPRLRQIGLDGTRNVCEVALQLGVRRLVYISSAAAVAGFREPGHLSDEATPFNAAELTDCLYAQVKHEAEALVLGYARDHRLDAVICNLGEVYGPNDTGLITAGNLVDAAAGRLPLRTATPGGTGVVHVADAAAGIVLALERGRAGERYILSAENLSVEEIVHEVLAIIRRPAWVVRVPARAACLCVRALAAAHLPTPIVPEAVTYATRYWYVTAAKARRELGWDPRPGREALRDACEWLRTAGYIQY